jgi:formylglycine-generating enzyme required for sulfatase activity
MSIKIYPGKLNKLLLVIILTSALVTTCDTNPTSPAQETTAPPVDQTEEATRTPYQRPPEGIGLTMISDKNNMVMVFVPAGEFEMGIDSSREGPIRTIYLDEFWIYKTEVSNAMFAAFLNARENQSESGTTWMNTGGEGVRIQHSGGVWSADEGYENHPVVQVTWHGAKEYCEWSKDRLPTEAEWEKAARGTDGRTYPWGEGVVACHRAQINEYSCVNQPVPVDRFPNGASPYGALNMVGNVWEWVADWDKPGGYPSRSLVNPTGPSTGSYRILRGGSYNSWMKSYEVFSRYSYDPGRSAPDIGFRCASTPKETAVIPDVIGLTRKEAYQILEELGFNPLTFWVMSDDYGYGTVSEITPAVGEKVSLDAEIILGVVGEIVKQKPSGGEEDGCANPFTLVGTQCEYEFSCAIIQPPMSGIGDICTYCVNTFLGGINPPGLGCGIQVSGNCYCFFDN